MLKLFQIGLLLDDPMIIQTNIKYLLLLQSNDHYQSILYGETNPP